MSMITLHFLGFASILRLVNRNLGTLLHHPEHTFLQINIGYILLKLRRRQTNPSHAKGEEEGGGGKRFHYHVVHVYYDYADQMTKNFVHESLIGGSNILEVEG